jgi:hypothetical protein
MCRYSYSLNEGEQMNLSKDQLMALMNTIDFATDFDTEFKEYTIIESGTTDLEPIRNILYNEYVHQTE